MPFVPSSTPCQYIPAKNTSTRTGRGLSDSDGWGQGQGKQGHHTTLLSFIAPLAIEARKHRGLWQSPGLARIRSNNRTDPNLQPQRLEISQPPTTRPQKKNLEYKRKEHNSSTKGLLPPSHLEAELAPREVVRHGEMARDGGEQVPLKRALPKAEELVPPVVAPGCRCVKRTSRDGLKVG